MTSSFWQGQNFRRVVPTCLGRILEPRPKQQQTTSEPSKVYNPTKTIFRYQRPQQEGKIQVPGSPNKLGCLPTISQTSLQPTGKVTTLWTTETGQIQQDSKQGSKAVRQRLIPITTRHGGNGRSGVESRACLPLL